MGHFYFFCDNCEKESVGNLVSTTTNYEIKKTVNTYRCDTCKDTSNKYHDYTK